MGFSLASFSRSLPLVVSTSRFFVPRSPFVSFSVVSGPARFFPGVVALAQAAGFFVVVGAPGGGAPLAVVCSSGPALAAILSPVAGLCAWVAFSPLAPLGASAGLVGPVSG